MSKIRVAINGFGRIGRNTFKAAWERKDLIKNLEFVAVNDLTSPEILAHLLQHDTVFRKWNHEVGFDQSNLIIDGKKVLVVSEKDPANLPWKKLKVDVVLECTGRFTSLEDAEVHIKKAGAKRVIISAPAKGGIPTFLQGVNVDKKISSYPIISNASCTTNCTGPVAEVISSKFGVLKAALTTIHSVTPTENIVDSSPSPLKADLRRARSAMVNTFPTTTGAAQATAEALPELKGIFDGLAIRVPTIDVSISDLTFLVKRKTMIEEVNAAFIAAAKTPRYKGILGVSKEPLVSSDYIGNAHSAIVDLSFTNVIDGDLVKVLAWYDNEWGYSNRLAEMAVVVGKGL